MILLITLLASCKVNKYIEKNICLANLESAAIVVDENALIKDRVIISFTEQLQEELMNCNSHVLYKPMLEYEIKKERLQFYELATDEEVMREGLSIDYLLKTELVDAKTGLLLQSFTNLEKNIYPNLEDETDHQIKIAFSLIDLKTNKLAYLFDIKSRSIPLGFPADSDTDLNYYLNLSTLQGTLQSCLKKAVKKISQRCACSE